MFLDLKIVAAIVATIIAIAAFVPYIRDIFRGTTKPHAYTWLIWVIVQGIAVAGILHGGGKWGAFELAVATVLVLFVFLLSLKYGTKNITKFDTVALVAACVAALVWWIFKKADLAVLLVTIIDILGYIPTIRKIYQEPGSETLATWVAFTIGNIFSIFALSEYNFLTLVFIVSTTVINGLIALLIVVRRSTSGKTAF